MPKNLNIQGTQGNSYNLDELTNNNTRSDSSQELLVQIWMWCPDLPSTNPHSKPNPANPVIGQMWLSKLVKKGTPDYETLLALGESEG